MTNKSKIIVYDEIIIRPPTGTKETIKIVIAQKQDEDGNPALASAVVTGIKMPWLLEKPDIMEDIAMGLIRAAGQIRQLNQKVKKNGK